MYNDPILGRTQVKSTIAKHQLIQNQNFIYNVTYYSDEFGRRITPTDRPEKIRNNFLVLFGCSFTYGHGLEANETIPYYLGKELPDYYPLNYGIVGSAANLTVALLESRDLKKEISQKNGIAIYSYIDNHLERIIGSNYWAYSQPSAPYYKLKDGKAQRNGTFESGRPLQTYIQKKLFESNYRKKFNIGYPFFLTKSDRETVCGVMEQMKIEFLKQYPDSKFYINFLPGSGRDFPYLSRCLKKRNVSFIDTRNALNGYNVPLSIPIDGHPNANSNRIVTNALIQLLKLK